MNGKALALRFAFFAAGTAGTISACLGSWNLARPLLASAGGFFVVLIASDPELIRAWPQRERFERKRLEKR